MRLGLASPDSLSRAEIESATRHSTEETLHTETQIKTELNAEEPEPASSGKRIRKRNSLVGAYAVEELVPETRSSRRKLDDTATSPDKASSARKSSRLTGRIHEGYFKDLNNSVERVIRECSRKPSRRDPEVPDRAHVQDQDTEDWTWDYWKEKD
eukprot:CAMPEP_0184665608 /NCGR_PEP_ID=MMETSP0308-20130426/57887_1 /TAXON_ID=38269 /ORGANISM="Gloeochaete witrockiana, Strain SAG 46.84" /LENGTH=154 /DNA_ID=CAMNT_0027109711 /DNA_START=126 /DNA_END=590 /DNA_ORIENTATION=+